MKKFIFVFIIFLFTLPDKVYGQNYLFRNYYFGMNKEDALKLGDDALKICEDDKESLCANHIRLKDVGYWDMELLFESNKLICVILNNCSLKSNTRVYLMDMLRKNGFETWYIITDYSTYDIIKIYKSLGDRASDEIRRIFKEIKTGKHSIEMYFDGSILDKIFPKNEFHKIKDIFEVFNKYKLDERIILVEKYYDEIMLIFGTSFNACLAIEKFYEDKQKKDF